MLMTQVVLLRELSSLYSVNELIVGVFLSFWLVFAGAGAFSARYFKKFRWQNSWVFPLLSGVSALLSLWMLYIAREWFAAGGAAPGFTQWLLATAMVTFVFCFPTGMMFTWFSAAMSINSGKNKTVTAYIAEQAGSLTAGLLFYLSSLLWLNPFEALSLLLIINFLTILMLLRPLGSFKKSLSFIVLGLVIALYFMPQYRLAREMVHGRRVARTHFSPYGSIDVLKENDDRKYFESGRYLGAELIQKKAEEFLHPAVLLHSRPRRMLLVNVEPGLLPEALKYDSLEIDFVSSDIARIRLGEKLLNEVGEINGKVKFIEVDPFHYLKRQLDKPYDIILIGGGIPADLSSTRFYVSGFLKMLKQNLAPRGLLILGGIDYSSSLSESRKGIFRVMHQTVKDIFPHVRVWAGNKVFFIASQQSVDVSLSAGHQKFLKCNKYLREDIFPDTLLESRVRHVEEILEMKVPVNTRVHPVLFRLALEDVEDFWDLEKNWLAVILSILLILGLIFFRESSKGVFLAGIALGSMQVVFLLLWQMVMGDLFRATGLLFSLFMAGLALGAWLGRNGFSAFRPRYFPVLLMVIAFISILSVPVLNSMAGTWFFPVMTSLIILALAVVGGGIFVAGISLNRRRIQHGAALVYAADVAGGALGAFLSVLFLVPFTGLINTGYLMGLSLLIGALLLMKRI